MGRKSTTCIGKISGKPLTEYNSLEEAEDGAVYANEAHGSSLVSYACSVCGKWHLSPKERVTPSEKCHYCTGTNGRQKEAYRSRGDAERRADILRREQGVFLTVYPCEYSDAWHLTRDTRP